LKKEISKAIADAQMHAGAHQLAWSAKDAKQNAVNAGFYFLKMTAGNYSETKKISVIK
jgi:flagellar hook assembly protein FlgD